MKGIIDLNETELCLECGDLVIKFAKTHGQNIMESQENCQRKTNDQVESLSCNCCENEIEAKDTYYELTVDDNVLDSIADRIGKDIGGCTWCEGEERGYLVHLFNNDPYDKDSRMDPPEGISVNDYLSAKDVPEELYQLMCKHLQCPCGHGREVDRNMNHGWFNLHDDIYTKQDVEEYWGHDYEQFCVFSEKYGETIEVEALKEFKVYLSNYPLLALKHDVGQAIYRTLEKHFQEKDYTVITPEFGCLYRGRTRKRDTTKPFSKENMWAPPAGLPQHGRYNCIGVPVLYVCNRLDAIPYEIHPTHEDTLDIGDFQILKDELKLFDIGSFDPNFQGFFNEENEETKALKEAYLLPNFIGACCSLIGFNGVQYEGVHSNVYGNRSEYNTYINFALFNITPDKDIEINNILSYTPQITISLKEIPKTTTISPVSYF
ncbi:hypothetical protein PPM_p0137 (plasmid) [Paenibacillus polymyxa M1]|uniref:hypothetical protein n=1 Tax=Paenibacillus polymyxa TaxID=1406 RepID=UPI00021BBB75|nr:hypothetical protein [Paenibacillus polymyxa]CCC86287.1 hypothetical protein PPM_p0137 [Paenibacillus polymyxa M1]